MQASRTIEAGEALNALAIAQVALSAQVVWRYLGANKQFAEYERRAGLLKPDPTFRRAIALELGRYIVGTWAEAVPFAEPAKDVAKAKHNLRITRNRLVRQKMPLSGNSDLEEALAAWLEALTEAKRHARRRGPPEKEFGRVLVHRLAAAFQAATGSAPTFDENSDGVFSDVLRLVEVHYNELGRLMTPTARRRFPTNLPRFARAMLPAAGSKKARIKKSA